MKKFIEGNNKVTAAAIKKIVVSEGSKSSKMKQLFDLGMTVKEISIEMNVRYNFVYNVVSNYIVTDSIEVEKSNKVSKKDIIIELYLEGKSNKEISIELKTNYNYVYNTIKQYKLSNEVVSIEEDTK